MANHVKSGDAARAARLAAALKENLKRRKAQARARAAEAPEDREPVEGKAKSGKPARRG